MVQVSIRTVGSTRLRVVHLPAESDVAAVRRAIERELGMPYERLKLVVGGKTLEDEKNDKPVMVKFVDGDSMIAMLVPKAPPKHISSRGGEIEDEDEDLVCALTEGFFDTCLYEVAVSELTIDRHCWRLIHCEGAITFLLATVQRFKIQDSATPLQRRLAQFMREKLRVPDVLLILLFSLSPRTWLLIFLWFALAPFAHQWDLGPMYIIVTAFAVIFFNLGKRQVGEASAYSIFNEGFRELPGTLNADRLDRDIRAGQF